MRELRWAGLAAAAAAMAIMFFFALSSQEPAWRSSSKESKPIQTADKALQTKPAIHNEAKREDLKRDIVRQFQHEAPKQWGEYVPGVLTHLVSDKKVVALTFDACGGTNGNGYDRKLIDYLISQRIPATLFINSRWIDANLKTFLELAKNPLFEIENHGTEHRPLSINGKSAYGIPGTKNAGEVIDEVWVNSQKIKQLTGRTPKYFRSGTAYYDEVAVKIVKELGEQPVNFNVLGDAGATFSKNQIVKQFSKAGPNSIIIFHMNHPEKQTADGVMAGVPRLLKEGYQFVRLEDYPLQ
ncbi:polysaccharide deacetylase family protein [Ferviditalea candida]|uniref:Polysaccharide deacetylase family protein n=1 Tax=Ferviditalea candida TaxID=3108399 RepID=A0ABU5ZLM6_9BACL|nr:polysaccharide deacetylase family protein [Paenibacillaceae bacterium T2]